MNPKINYVFAKGATSPDDPEPKICSKPYVNNSCDAIAVEISGSFTSASVAFEGKADLNAPEYTSLSGVNLTTFDLTTTATGKGIWEIGVEGIQVFRARVVSVSGGDITVLGRCVASSQ